MPRHSYEYRRALLPQEDPDEKDDSFANVQATARVHSRRSIVIMAALLALSVSLNLIQAWSATSSKLGVLLHLYESRSPAWGVVEHKPRRFGRATAVVLPWQGPPSDEVDAAWEDLYNFGISKVPKADAAKMLNHTVAIPGDEGNFVIALDVFHQLHCLNTVRKALHPEYYPKVENVNGFDHVGHCINSLRENIMCTADVTPNVWKWNDMVGEAFPRLDVVHECRNFDVIRDWAKARHVREFNFSMHALDDLEIEDIHF